MKATKKTLKSATENNRVYNYDDGKYRYANPSQELEFRESESAFKNQPNGRLIRKSVNTSSEYEIEENKRVERIIMSNKKTQTPIRAVTNEAVQYDSDEWAQSKVQPVFSKHAKTPSDLGKRSKVGDEEEKLPFSTIKK